MPKSAHSRVWALAFAACALALSSAARADSITIEDKTYSDVLVYESATAYYVKLPLEGRVLNVDKDKVDASTVSLSTDPYVRDQLQEKYDDARARREAGEEVGSQPTTDSVFATAAAEGAAVESIDAMSLLEGGASAGTRGMGVSLAEAKGAFASLGVNFAEGPSRGGQPSVTGRTSSGIAQIDLIGPPENLTTIAIGASVPQQQMGQLMGLFQPIGGIASKVAPWAPAWMTQNQGKLMTGQAIQQSQGGIKIVIAPGGDASGNITLRATIQGV